MSNEELNAAVGDELHWDPKVDGDMVVVSAAGGVVTLRGTVGSFHQKREAKKAAERVQGVADVKNQLQVRLMTASARDDAELRADVLRALTLDSQVPDTVDAKVSYGFVTLTGPGTRRGSSSATRRSESRDVSRASRTSWTRSR